ncbi:MFS transporter [Brevibacillus dissolubilis]|uniref:MFS transporter n=1 Tax=Brevibacillus dissolubilis TaxID=1844116 RepID=UPI001115E2AC|nr:MFS transporter [Brevibacillus dissolubilis]
MEEWKRNLFVLCGALFFVMVGMSMVMPFLPLFIQNELGVTDPKAVTAWAGVIFGANFLTAGIMSPIWGNLADKHGRKIMILRSGFLMAVIVALTGLSGSVWQLLGLRLLNGTIAGIVPASNALVASTAPKERAGWAQGTLQSAVVAGTIMGPLFGGILADWVGFRMVFVVTGCLLFLSTLVITFTVKENFTPPPAKEQTSIRQDAKLIFSSKGLPSLFIVTVMIQFSLFSINPILSIFVQSIVGYGEKVAFYAGMVSAFTGVANVLASPQLGKLGDRFGSEKVLLFSLLAAALIMIPTAFVTQLWQLIALRFLLGLCLGGLLPSVNALIRRRTPSHMVSRVFGYNNSFVCLGSLLGPITGGFVAGSLGFGGVFLVTSFLLLLNFCWVWYSISRHRRGEGESRAAA